MRRMHNGFTLIEALIVLAAASILLCVAVPSWRDSVHATRSAAAKASFADTWLASVHHAALTGVEVVVCPGAAPACRDSTDWSHGWMAYADLDGDRARDENETLLRQVAPLDDGVHLTGTAGRTRLVFQPNGGNAGSNATFTLCDGRGAAAATTLVMSNEGRLRQGTPTPEAARNCVYAP